MRKPLITLFVGALIVFGLVFGLGMRQTFAQESTPTQTAQTTTKADKHKKHPLAKALVKETLAQTGLTRAELKAELQAGKSLAQVASEHNSSEAAVVAPVLAELSERLDEAVANGRITAEEKAALMARAAERATVIMNKTKETKK